jgi:RNA polymerase sigma-70 factor (ECF subfamily)
MLDERQHLLEIAEARSGSAATAALVVAETYRHWYELDDRERARIGVARQWLTGVAADIGLQPHDEIRASARKHDGSTRNAGADQPGTGVDRELGRLDRQLPSDSTDLQSTTVHDQTAARFVAACHHDDQQLLVSLLAADAVAISDGGAQVRAAVSPVQGAVGVARFVTDLLSRQADIDLSVAPVNGRAGLVARRGGRVVAVLSLAVVDASVTTVWISLNPTKMHGWPQA